MPNTNVFTGMDGAITVAVDEPDPRARPPTPSTRRTH